MMTGIAYHDANGGLLTRRGYEYDEIGNVVARQRQHGVDLVETDVFSHNARSELTAATLGGTNALAGAYAYGCDPIGNRAYASSSTAGGTRHNDYVANELNQYTGISTVPGNVNMNGYSAVRRNERLFYDQFGGHVSGGVYRLLYFRRRFIQRVRCAFMQNDIFFELGDPLLRTLC